MKLPLVINGKGFRFVLDSLTTLGMALIGYIVFTLGVVLIGIVAFILD